MQIKLDEQNSLKIDPARGGRLLEVRLGGRVVVKSDGVGLGSGCYLMYPWVNRIEKIPWADVHPPYMDCNQLPLHGMFVDQARTVEITVPQAGSIAIKMRPIKKIEGVPSFTEVYTLTAGKLMLDFKIDEDESELPLCFGYHPYLQIDDIPLKDLTLTSDITTELELDNNLLPIIPYQSKQIQLSSTQQYDSLFQGGTYLQLRSSDNFCLKITTTLPFWQIYTPPDGLRIAVQPMSHPANIYTAPAPSHHLVRAGRWSLSVCSSI